jgi:hypothetical protein
MGLLEAIFGSGSDSSDQLVGSNRRQLIRLEKKVDLILKHLGLEYVDSDPISPEGLSEAVQTIAAEPGRKIEAIRVHRLETGLGLKEAKDAVEAYIARRPRVGPP